MKRERFFFKLAFSIILIINISINFWNCLISCVPNLGILSDSVLQLLRYGKSESFIEYETVTLYARWVVS